MVYPYKFKKWRGKPRRKSGTLATGRVYRAVARKKYTRNSSKIHLFNRTVKIGTMDLDGAEDGGAITFQLSSLPNYTEFTELYDQYMICGIRVELIPRFSSSDINPLDTYSTLPCVHSVLDFNDITGATGLDDMLQYMNYKRTRGNVIHRRYFRPAVLVQTVSTGTGKSSKWGVWLDTSDATVPHYSFWYRADAAGSDGHPIYYDIYAKYYFKCRNVK